MHIYAVQTSYPRVTVLPASRVLHFTLFLQRSSSGSSRPPPEMVSGVSLEATVRIAGVGVSVIDASPRELLYLTVGGISLDYLREGQVI